MSGKRIEAARETAVSEENRKNNKESRTGNHMGEQTRENILVCLSSAPSNAKIIRRAARMEETRSGSLTAFLRRRPGLHRSEKRDAAARGVLRERAGKSVFTLSDTIKFLLSLVMATSLSLLFYRWGLSDANIITVYILGVLITSVVTEHMIYGVLASVASVFIFNYLFTDPRYTLLAYDIGYPMTFLVMLLASLLTGTLAARMKNLAYQSAVSAYRTKILLDTNQSLQHAADREAIVRATADQLSKLTGRDVAIHLPEDCDLEQLLSGGDSDDRLYCPIRLGGVLYGVADIDVRDNPVDAFENGILMSILGECALALENEKNAREKEDAAVLAQNEQLRANLLRTISHDLRTPLTSISGNASNLMTNGADFDEATKQQLYTDIYDDSMWLINLVENLLSVTRMEDGGVELHKDAELMDEVMTEALRHIDRRRTEHTIRVKNENELLLVQMDARLIVQVIINLVNNAVKYTQKGSVIEISVREENHMAVVSVADDGPGIPDEMKPQIFELFYTGEHPVTDGRRSMGLGLALCKSIVTAHGGMITVSDADPHGAVFTFTLPVKEVQLHE